MIHMSRPAASMAAGRMVSSRSRTSSVIRSDCARSGRMAGMPLPCDKTPPTREN